MKRSFCKHYPNAASLFLRLGLAAVFIPHGWQKIQDIDQFVQFVGSLGFAAVFAYFVALLEFVGGIFLVLGILTEYVSWLLAVEMLVVVMYVKADAPFIGGVEFEYMILFAAAALALLGPGKYALEKRLRAHTQGGESEEMDESDQASREDGE